jgi:predicted ABC-type sugar transport system permease subunit
MHWRNCSRTWLIVGVQAQKQGVGWYLLTRTRFGLHTRTLSGDARNTRRAGIN